MAPQVDRGHTTGYSYAHAHIAHIKNTGEHCVRVTDHSGWRFSTMHVMKYLHSNYCMYTSGIRINAKLVKEGLTCYISTINVWSYYVSYNN